MQSLSGRFFSGARLHFSALSEDDPVSPLLNHSKSADVLVPSVLPCPRGIEEFYPHTSFRIAGIRIEENDIAVGEGKQNIFRRREHLQCFEDSPDLDREVRNTNRCVRLLMEKPTLAANPGKLERNKTWSRSNEGAGVRARQWCYVFTHNMTWILISVKQKFADFGTTGGIQTIV